MSENIEARSLPGVLFSPSMIEGQTKMEDHDNKIFIRINNTGKSPWLFSTK